MENLWKHELFLCQVNTCVNDSFYFILRYLKYFSREARMSRCLNNVQAKLEIKKREKKEYS